MILIGSRVELRGVEAADLDDRYRWLNNPDIVRYFTNLAKLPLTRSQLANWHEKTFKNERELHFSVYTMHHQHIGGAQLKEIDWLNRSAEFGLFIGETEYWAKGYGMEITRLILTYAFETLNLHRVCLRVDKDNAAAVRCYQKCGLKQEGIFREEVFRDGKYHDSMIMSILKKEWLSST